MEIKTVSCIGVGQIGQGWATIFASKGFAVILYDISEEILENAVNSVESNLRFLKHHELLNNIDISEVISNIKTTTTIKKAVSN